MRAGIGYADDVVAAVEESLRARVGADRRDQAAALRQYASSGSMRAPAKARAAATSGGSRSTASGG
ncbi:MAG: hypothetical protein KIS84_07865 [Dokdonella sp.]|nr:hypothetical protein [Dokdonella sp.]